jgi:hypothetical protein
MSGAVPGGTPRFAGRVGGSSETASATTLAEEDASRWPVCLDVNGGSFMA